MFVFLSSTFSSSFENQSHPVFFSFLTFIGCNNSIIYILHILSDITCHLIQFHLISWFDFNLILIIGFALIGLAFSELIRKLVKRWWNSSIASTKRSLLWPATFPYGYLPFTKTYQSRISQSNEMWHRIDEWSPESRVEFAFSRKSGWGWYPNNLIVRMRHFISDCYFVWVIAKLSGMRRDSNGLFSIERVTFWWFDGISVVVGKNSKTDCLIELDRNRISLLIKTFANRTPKTKASETPDRDSRGRSYFLTHKVTIVKFTSPFPLLHCPNLFFFVAPIPCECLFFFRFLRWCFYRHHHRTFHPSTLFLYCICQQLSSSLSVVKSIEIARSIDRCISSVLVGCLSGQETLQFFFLSFIGPFVQLPQIWFDLISIWFDMILFSKL